jgi:vacuolar-type H+-ATPase subunit B/Vma2
MIVNVEVAPAPRKLLCNRPNLIEIFRQMRMHPGIGEFVGKLTRRFKLRFTGRQRKARCDRVTKPILTMPSDDITHPIPDLTGYITEGQIVLDRDLDRKGIYPPVNVLSCLSRLMKDGTGAGFTDVDHPDLANQLYAAYARAVHMRVLASVVGRDGLAETDRQFLDFGDRFEMELVKQEGARSLEQSMAIGWQLLRSLPVTELHRLSDRQVEMHIAESSETK